MYEKLPAKGQLISKGNFSVFHSPINELENVNFCPSILGQNFFLRFLGELKKTKSGQRRRQRGARAMVR
jgi:hypothetical protein